MKKQTTGPRKNEATKSKSEERRIAAIRKGSAEEAIKSFTKHAQVLEKNDFIVESRSVRRVIDRLTAFTKGEKYLTARRRKLNESK